MSSGWRRRIEAKLSPLARLHDFHVLPVGEKGAVVTVRKSQIEPLTADERLTVRPCAGAIR